MGMTNKTLTIDCNKEYTNKPLDIGGIRQIKLGYRPAGVEVWISTENTGDNLYKLENKGDGWINLPEVLENCYITTKGTNVDDKLVLYYSGDYSDFYATGNAVTGRINEVESLKTIGINAIHSLNNIKTIYDTSKIKFLKWINGDFTITKPVNWNNEATVIWLTKLADLSQLTFDYLKCYKITIEGHADIGGLESQQEGGSSGDWKYIILTRSLHLDIIDLKSVNFNDNSTLLDSNTYPNIDNIYELPPNFLLETKSNHFCFWGIKQTKSQDAGNRNNSIPTITMMYTPTDINFKKEYIGFGFLFLTMQDIVLSFQRYNATNYTFEQPSGFHFSLAIKIEVLDAVPNAPIIDSNPYINNNI